MTTPSRESTLMRTALRLGAQGVRCFPIDADRKPAISGYFGDAPFTPAQTRRQPWARAAGIGLAVPGNHVVLDVDVKGGKQGETHLHQLQIEYGSLPPAPEQATRSGGRHLLYRTVRRLKRPRSRLYSVANDLVTDIDLVQSTNRYIVMYDEDFARLLGAQSNAIPLLPSTWLRALEREGTADVESGQRVASPRRTPAPQSTVLFLDAASVVAQVRSCIHNRNDHLVKATFRIAIRGQLTPEVSRMLIEAAIQSGLQPQEVQKAILSAERKAAAQWEPLIPFVQAAQESAGNVSRRQRHNLIAVAAVLAVYCAVHQRLTVGLSHRELGEIIGVCKDSAGGSLRQLVRQGLIQVESPSTATRATRYQVIPVRNSASHDQYLPTSSSLDIWRRGEGLADFRTVSGLVRRVLLRSHDAFIRTNDGTPSLSHACLDILLELEREPHDRSTLTRATGCSPSTVGKTLLTLQSAGLLTEQDGQFELTSNDLKEALDGWVTSMKIENRTARRRSRHENERLWNGVTVAAKGRAFRWAEEYRERRARSGDNHSFGHRAAQTAPLLQVRAHWAQVRTAIGLQVPRPTRDDLQVSQESHKTLSQDDVQFS